MFSILRLWALVAAQSVIDLALLPEYRTSARILPFAIDCFDARAMISGLLAAFSRFTRMTFLADGRALLPLFAFNWWFTVIDPVFTTLGLLDVAGNVVMLGLCVMGWRRSAR